MRPQFLVEDGVRREDGSSPVLDISDARGNALLITLGITRIMEQESLDVSIWGSADGNEWGAQPLGAFPQKFYCGTYSIVVDLAGHPDVALIQARWKMNRWGRGEPRPLFGFYVFAEKAPVRAFAAG